MMRYVTRYARPTRLPALCAFALLGLGLLLPGQARAWWRGGVWIAPPAPVYVAPPPVYYAPPAVVYAPPPAYYAPPPVTYEAPAVPLAPPPQPGTIPGYVMQPRAGAQQSTAGAGEPGRTCYAGNYTCPLNGNYAPGTTCACPAGNGTNAYGRAG